MAPKRGRTADQTQLSHFTEMETKRVLELVVAEVGLGSKVLRLPSTSEPRRKSAISPNLASLLARPAKVLLSCMAGPRTGATPLLRMSRLDAPLSCGSLSRHLSYQISSYQVTLPLLSKDHRVQG